MAHIQIPEGVPGILGPMAISPESTKALRALAEVLLRGPNTLTPAEREMTSQLGYVGRDYKRPLQAIANKSDKAEV
jgi:hypothetical protein